MDTAEVVKYVSEGGVPELNVLRGIDESVRSIIF